MKEFPRICTLFLFLANFTVFASNHKKSDLDLGVPNRARRQVFSGFCDDLFDDKRNAVLQQAKKTPVTPGPATAAYIGQGGRMEMVEATIKAQNLDQGSTTNAAIVTHARSLGGPDDDAGHIIANRLGGTGRDKWNIFPQSKNINRGEWAKQEDTAYNIVQLGNTVKYTVILEYCNGGTRPTKIWYRWQYKDKDGDHCFSGDLVNPESTPSRGRSGRRVSRRKKGACLGSGKSGVKKAGRRSGSKSRVRGGGGNRKRGRGQIKRKFGGKKSSRKTGKSKGGRRGKNSRKSGSKGRGKSGSSRSRGGSKKPRRN